MTNHLDDVKRPASFQSGRDSAVETLLLLLAPSTPHLCEELWGKTGMLSAYITGSGRPGDESLTREDEITLVVQVNGKLRDRVIAPVALTEAEARELALGSEKVRAYLDNNRCAA